MATTADSTLEVAVSTSIGNRKRAKTCHEPDENGEPMCNSRGRYRLVDPTVYPDREPCTKDDCWADGVPDVLEDES